MASSGMRCSSNMCSTLLCQYHSLCCGDVTSSRHGAEACCGRQGSPSTVVVCRSWRRRHRTLSQRFCGRSQIAQKHISLRHSQGRLMSSCHSGCRSTRRRQPMRRITSWCTNRWLAGESGGTARRSRTPTAKALQWEGNQPAHLRRLLPAAQQQLRCMATSTHQPLTAGWRRSPTRAADPLRAPPPLTKMH